MSTKVSRWDRPPEPRDWRFFVGLLGRVFITLGLLLFGFVAYQLWGTGLETARTQETLGAEFETANAEGATTDPAPTTSGPVPAPTTSVQPPAGDTPTGATVSSPTTVADHTVAAVDKPPVEVIPGKAIVKLDIPKIGKELFVLPGVRPADLHKGPGHYPNTPMPGQLGNSAIAGHRTTSGEPFADVDQLEPGDELVVTNRQQERFVYRVTGSQIVTPQDTWVVETSDPNIAELTLTSCHPKYSARQRIVINSVLVPEKSSVVGTASFYKLDDPTTASPSSPEGSPTTVAEPAAANSTSDGSKDGSSDNDGPSPTDGTTPGATSEASDAANAQAVDAFSQGWFHDKAAFPHIAMWGLAMSVIAMLSYALSRRFRNHFVGFTVGVAPFVVSSYFFFQNVNRLLPPGL